MKPVIVILGRPNVGKSTIFNRLTKSKDALVATHSGLTRDRHYKEASFHKKSFILVDTGGLAPLTADGLLPAMLEQTQIALNEADAVIFIVDARSGRTPHDELLANWLRLSKKPVYLVANKSEGLDQISALSDFYELGFKKIYAVSALHNQGINHLLESVLSPYQATIIDSNDVRERKISFAIVGKPNAGKSTLVNSILGQERMVVSDIAGTTTDSIYIPFEYHNNSLTIIDTAGIRKKGAVVDKIEKFSILKSLQAISIANEVVILIDATIDITEQDAIIAGYALDAGKAIVIAINKWDSLTEDQKLRIKYNIKYKLPFLEFANFLFISALKKKGITELLNAILVAHQAAFIKIPTPQVTRIIIEAVRRTPPPNKGQFRPKVRYAHQGGSNPPLFVIHGNNLTNLNKNYLRYLERSIRESFNLIGTPIKIECRDSTNPYDKQ